MEKDKNVCVCAHTRARVHKRASVTDTIMSSTWDPSPQSHLTCRQTQPPTAAPLVPHLGMSIVHLRGNDSRLSYRT